MSESIPAQLLKVSSCDLGCDMYLRIQSASVIRFIDSFIKTKRKNADLRLEEVKVPEILSSRSSVVVSRVKPLVVLDPADEVLLGGELSELLVVSEELGRRLGDEDVVAEGKGLFGDGVVGGVGSEDDDETGSDESGEGSLDCNARGRRAEETRRDRRSQRRTRREGGTTCKGSRTGVGVNGLGTPRGKTAWSGVRSSSREGRRGLRFTLSSGKEAKEQSIPL